MISGFSKPWSPVFMVLLYQNTSKHIRKCVETSLKTYYFYIYGLQNVCQFRNISQNPGGANKCLSQCIPQQKSNGGFLEISEI